MQQFSFIDLFIDLFESALHDSGDKLAHQQQYRCIVPNLYVQSKVLLKMGEFCLPKHVEQIQVDQ